MLPVGQLRFAWSPPEWVVATSLCQSAGRYPPPHGILKAAVWFRRGRLLIVSPDSLGTACPLSGRNSTYRPVQILEAGSMLRHFLINLISVGIDPPYRDDTRRGRLEFGRHYGIPSPLIDFSRSPYIAAFFAFSGVRPYESKRADRSAIYCVNVFELAGVWARLMTPKFGAATAADATETSRTFTESYN